MISVVEFAFTDAKSGKVVSSGGSYSAVTGWANCQTGQETLTGDNWRAYFCFDTSSLPDHAQITKVEFFIKLAGGLVIDPIVYEVSFSIGSFIGAALDGSAEEWNGGTSMVHLYQRPLDRTWLDLAQGGGNPGAYVNRTGETDVKVWDHSVGDAEHTLWFTAFNTSTGKCRLRVTYSVPSATATGRGAAAAAAGVIVPGVATATGRGVATAGAQVLVAGAAAATAQGAAQLGAWIESCGLASATGRAAAACRLDAVYFPPVAVHEGTRTIRAADMAVRSVPWVNARTCAAGEG